MTHRLAPFFIVGAGRSGTTLLRAALAAHSRLSVPPETHFCKLADRHGARTAEAPADFAAFWSDLTRRRRFLDLGLDPEAVLARAQGRRFRDIFDAMLCAYAAKEGKDRWGEKTPGHARYLDRIFAWYPQARIVAIRRDPRAVVASHLGSPWVTEQMKKRGRGAALVKRLRLYHAAERARDWNDIYATYLARADEDPRIHVVRYETVVAHPERELRAVTEFLGETFEPAMVSERGRVSGSAAKHMIQSDDWRSWVAEHERRAAAPISSEGTEKWRETLSPLEVRVIEAICGPEMERLGYAPKTASRRRAPAAWLGRALLRASAAESYARWRLSGGRAQPARPAAATKA